MPLVWIEISPAHPAPGSIERMEIIAERLGEIPHALEIRGERDRVITE